MPQFVFIELPSFRIKDVNGHSVSLTLKQLGTLVASYHYVRSGIRTDRPPSDRVGSAEASCGTSRPRASMS